MASTSHKQIKFNPAPCSGTPFEESKRRMMRPALTVRSVVWVAMLGFSCKPALPSQL